MLSQRQWILLGGSALVAGFVEWYWGAGPVAGAQIVAGYVANTFTRGQHLTSSTLTDGVVVETPAELEAAAANVLGFVPDSDAYALARMGRSEGVDGMAFRMHVALNDLDNLRAHYPSTYPTVAALMTHSKVARADGHFSAQNLGKRYSTARDPYEFDYALAQQVQQEHDQGIDPTGGAAHFVDKDGPLYVDHVRVSFDDYVAARAKEGLTPTTLDGATENFVVFVTA